MGICTGDLERRTADYCRERERRRGSGIHYLDVPNDKDF